MTNSTSVTEELEKQASQINDRMAHASHTIATLESELHMWRRDYDEWRQTLGVIERAANYLRQFPPQGGM